MDEVTTEQLIIALGDPNYADHYMLLLSALSDRVIDKLSALDASIVEDIFSHVVRSITLKMNSTRTSAEELNLCLSILANLTINEVHAHAFVCKYYTSPRSQFSLISKKFLEHNSQMEVLPSCETEWISLDPWQYVGNVLCNIVRLEEGRKPLLSKSTGHMELLVQQIRSRNPTRRRGAVGTLRSFLFDNEVHWWIIDEVKALTCILSPLVVGAKPFTEKEKVGMDPILFIQAESSTKTVENDMEIMKMLLECILLLCQSRIMREELRRRKVYPIMRNLDAVVDEKEEQISGQIYEIVNFLERDEAPADEGLESDKK